MTSGSVFTRPVALVAAGLVLFATGALVTYLFLGRGAPSTSAGGAPATLPATPPAVAAPAIEPHAQASGPLPDVAVPVAADAARRAGIEVQTVRAGTVAGRLLLPGSVQPNQYRQVIVTPLVSGRVTSVAVQLGDRVARGAALARIYSSDLSEAQTRYISLRAELTAADARLKRTTRLAEIGAASRQELEMEEAQRTRLATEVQGVEARLRELGLSSQRLAAMSTPSQVSAIVVVPSPLEGIVTERKANNGLVVDPSAELFTVASLSPVWVIADVQEADLARVRVGSPATVTSDAYPGLAVAGKVTYIAPEVRAETRTAQVRVEIPNSDGRLRFGMFAHVEVAAPGAPGAVAVPLEAVQSIAGREFVYIARPGRSDEYIEREVTTGARDRDRVEILRGLEGGEAVVTRGSFLIRAERERLGLRTARPGSAAPTPAVGGPVKVTVGDAGFDPARIEVRKEGPVTLVFTRVSDATCAKELVVPGQDIRRPLPLNTPVTVEMTAGPGEVVFSCGMNMLKGAVVVAGR